MGGIHLVLGQPAESADMTDQEQSGRHAPLTAAKQDPDNNEFATPPKFWRRLAKPVGGFDLDPCSGAETTPIAPERFDADDNGLQQPWHGDVFVNPPWSTNGSGDAKHQWLEKVRSEASREKVSSVVVLMPSDTSTQWFHEHILAAPLVCFYGPGRLSFQGQSGSPPFGLLVAVYGDSYKAYRNALESIGSVVEGQAIYEPTHQATLSRGEYGQRE